MGISCGASVIKYGIFIFNLLCAVAGIALIVVGVIPLIKLGEISSAFPENNPALIPIAIISIGSLIFIISFFGCCGAIRENQCMVSTYACLLLVLVVLQIVVAVYAFIYTEEVANATRNGFDVLWRSRTQPESQAAIDLIQRNMQCCGSTGPASWRPEPLPTSCCANQATCTETAAFQVGCADLLHSLVMDSGLLIAWVAISLAAVELVGVIFACCLANSIRNANRRQYT